MAAVPSGPSLRRLMIASALLCAGLGSTDARASEGGTSFYLLGSGGPGAALLPPVEGIFLENTFYHYSGSTSGEREFSLGGNIVAGLQADINADFPTLLWVPTTDFIGGTLAFAGILPVARLDVDVDAVLTGPRGRVVDLRREDKATMIGDPILMAEMSWKLAPELHASLASLVNIPVGHYREGQLANLSFHRWVIDTSAALTWANKAWDISGKAGLTFNAENDFTDYDSGTDFHVEASIEHRFTKEFVMGLQAYHLQQVSRDQGAGAILGGNKGRVTGVGPTTAYTFMLGKAPVTARVLYMEEFGVKNRLDGHALFFTLNMPLKVKLPTAAATRRSER